MSKLQPTVYLAGPINGLSFDNCTAWRTDVARRLAPHITCFTPLRGKQYLGGVTKMEDSYLSHTLSARKSINERDHFDCKTCDLIFVNLLGAFDKVSIGTAMEVAWGFAYRKPVVLAIDRPSENPADPRNPHDHAMLIESSSFVVHSLEEAVMVTKAILLPEDKAPSITTVRGAEAVYCGDRPWDRFPSGSA